MNSPFTTLGQHFGLPHREPFLFISELVAIDPRQRGTGIWRVTGSEDFFRGHFPGNPVIPGVLLGESLAQLAGLVAFGSSASGHSSTSAVFQSARLARIDIKLPRAVVPPAHVQLEATVTRTLDGLVMFDVRATVGGEPVAVGSLVLAIAGNAAAALETAVSAKLADNCEDAV